jgi:hypothetical protein
MDLPRWVEPVRELQARVDAMQIMVSILLARLALRVGDPEGMLNSIVGAANTVAAQADESSSDVDAVISELTAITAAARDFLRELPRQR